MDTSDRQFSATADVFFSQFKALEQESVAEALRALSSDTPFASEIESLLEFDARLTLLKRLSLAHHLPNALETELDAVLLRARKLLASRDELREAIVLGQASDAAAPARPAHKPRRKRVGGRSVEELQDHLVAAYRMHTVSQIEAFIAETHSLQQTLHTLAQHLVEHRRAMDQRRASLQGVA